MSALLDGARVIGQAATVAASDFATMYTWRTWLFAWTGRVVAQVIFYALIGVLLDSADALRFLLIGNTVWVATNVTLLVVASTTWERRAGTLPLLVASPSRIFLTFLGRSVQWLPDAVVTALIGFGVAAVLFEVPVPLSGGLWALPLLALTVAATYGQGAFFGALVLRWMDARNTVSNVTMGVMAIVCGVNVPVEFFPPAVQVFAHLFPLTFGLQAIRDVLAGAAPGVVLPNVGWTMVAGLAWTALAAVSFDRLAESGRRDGTIEFGD